MGENGAQAALPVSLCSPSSRSCSAERSRSTWPPPFRTSSRTRRRSSTISTASGRSPDRAQKGKKISFAIKATDSNSNEALYSMDSDIPPTFVTEYKPTWGTTDAPTECISNRKECDNDAGSSICCNDGYDCYAKKSTYSQCRTSCPSSWTADGSCNNTDDAVDAASTTIIILVIVLVVIVG